MDKNVKKDIEFTEAVIAAAGSDKLLEQSVMSKRAFLSYQANVNLFASMTPEQFFTDAPYQGLASQIRAMREDYDKVLEADSGKEEEGETVAEAVASLREEIKALAESVNQASTDDPAVATDAPPAVDEEADVGDDTEAESKTED